MKITVQRVYPTRAWSETYTLFVGGKEIPVSHPIFEKLASCYARASRENQIDFHDTLDKLEFTFEIPKPEWEEINVMYKAMIKKIRIYQKEGFTTEQILSKMTISTF